jgi:hypothetical protein
VVAAVLAWAALACAACQSGLQESAPAEEPPPGAPGDLEPQRGRPADEVVNSGRTLDGVYELDGPAGRLAAARYVFTPEGAFSRILTLDGGPGPTSEVGSYLIDDEGRLVLYVERVNGGVLTTARREIVGLDGDPGDELTLEPEAGPEQEYAFTGPAPAPGPDRPSVE